jgi:hypothetical protein
LWSATLDGPLALPGHYKVRLTVDGKSQTREFDLLPDPRSTVTAQDLKKQFDLRMAIHDQLEQVQGAILEIRNLHEKLTAVRGDVKGKKAEAQVTQAADSLEQKVSTVEDNLIQRKAIANEDPLNFPIRLNNMLASLNQAVSHGDAAPNQPQYTEFNELQQKATEYLGEWNQLKTHDLAAFNSLIRKEKLPVIALAAR